MQNTNETSIFKNILNEHEVFSHLLKDPSKKKYTLRGLPTFFHASDEQKEEFKKEFEEALKEKFGDITDKIDYSFSGSIFSSDSDPKVGYVEFWLKDQENPDPKYFKRREYREGHFIVEAGPEFSNEVAKISESLFYKIFNNGQETDNFYALPKKDYSDWTQLQTVYFYEVRDGDIKDRYNDRQDEEFYKMFTEPLLKYGEEKIGGTLNKIAQEKGWSSWNEFVESKRFQTWQDKQDHGNSDRRASVFAKYSTVESFVYRAIDDAWEFGNYKEAGLEGVTERARKEIDWHADLIERNSRTSVYHYTALPTKTTPKPASERKPRTSNPENKGKKYYVRFEYDENGEYWDDKYGPYTAKEALAQYENLKKEYEYAMSQGTVALTLQNRLGRELQPNELKESVDMNIVREEVNIFNGILNG